MKILKLEDSVHSIKLVPRIFPNETDTLQVHFRNEITDEEEIVSHTWSYENNYFTLVLTPSVDFLKSYNKYELNILRSTTNIYKGRVLVISELDSVQDYKKTEVTVNKKLKF